ncbi:MAG: hypothetical protein QXJ68_05330 [Methanocellales archaeon]
MNEEVERWSVVIKCALDILTREEIEVINPFAYAIDEAIVRNSINIKRDRPKIYAIVDAITSLHRYQRPSFELYS